METLPVHYIDSSAKLQTLVSEIARYDIVGLDTEFISEGRYEPALCLVQLSTEKDIWILDPLAVPGLDEFWSVLLTGDRELVTVAARQEIRAPRAPGAPQPVFSICKSRPDLWATVIRSATPIWCCAPWDKKFTAAKASPTGASVRSRPCN